MTTLRAIGRLLLAALFVSSGIDVLRRPEPRVAVAAPVLDKLTRPMPESVQPVHLVRVNAALQLVAGVLLGLGRRPRLAALALAGSLVPTTVAGHRFWEEEDQQRRGMQRVHFMKNLAVLGGLLAVAGTPSPGGTKPG
jgi:uncharacterized membrane protein YphA (DoxX/SURF4 family)